jgi:hypothetical protein
MYSKDKNEWYHNVSRFGPHSPVTHRPTDDGPGRHRPPKLTAYSWPLGAAGLCNKASLCRVAPLISCLAAEQGPDAVPPSSALVSGGPRRPRSGRP